MFFPYAKLKTEEISGFCGKLTVFENKNNTTNAVVGGSEVELTVTIPKIFAPRSVNLYLYDENCIETRSICVGECIGWQNEYDAESGICHFYLSVFRERDGVYLREDEEQRERCYKKEQIITALGSAGFAVRGIYSGYHFEEPQDNTERWYFVAQKK